MAEGIIACAPDLPGWEFHASRPKKRWQFRFSMRNRRGQQVSIDANAWEYVLTRFDASDQFAITIVASDLPWMDDSAKLQAAHIVLESVLGERILLRHIDDVRISSNADHVPEDALTEIRYLGEHLSELLEGAAE